jgi:hypothetical protein
VIGDADDDRIDPPGFRLDHLAVIDIGPSILEAGLGSIEVIGIDVAQCDDVLTLDAVDVGGGAVGRADAGDPQLTVRRPLGR